MLFPWRDAELSRSSRRSLPPSAHQPDDAAALAAALVDSGGLRVTRRIIAEVSLKRPQGQIDPSPPEEEEVEEDEEGTVVGERLDKCCDV